MSPAYETVWGRPTESALAEREAWQLGVHPEDTHRVGRELAGATAGRVESSFRIVRPDGEVRWVVQSLFPGWRCERASLLLLTRCATNASDTSSAARPPTVRR